MNDNELLLIAAGIAGFALFGGINKLGAGLEDVGKGVQTTVESIPSILQPLGIAAAGDISAIGNAISTPFNWVNAVGSAINNDINAVGSFIGGQITGAEHFLGGFL